MIKDEIINNLKKKVNNKNKSNKFNFSNKKVNNNQKIVIKNKSNS